MANSKISALTAATTPLAGTEVLPIVQSSTTVKATIANVQAAPVSAGTANAVQYLNGSKVPTTSTALTFDGTKFTQTASTTAAAGLAEFKNTATNAQTGNITAINDAGTSLKVIVFGSAAGSYGTLTANSPMIYTAASELNLVANNASGVIKFGVGSTPNLMASIDANGNYIPAVAAKGINFTANTPAAGKTSQLLNWYEEGTWTPASGVGAATSNSGRYTRTGNVVYVSGTLTFPVQVNASGATITGLPFTSGATSRGACMIRYTNSSVGGFTIYVDDSNTTMGLYGFTGGAISYTQVSGNRLDFTGFYYTN